MNLTEVAGAACIAAGVFISIPWKSLASRLASPRGGVKPTVEPLSVIVDAAPVGVAEYITSLRKELVKESPDFILDCASKGLSVTESIKNAYQR